MFFNKKNKIDFLKEIDLNGILFEIEVLIIKKKSSSVRIVGQKLIFRLSSYLSSNQIKIHFEELLESISKKILKNPPNFQPLFKEILNGGYFIFAKERYLFEKTLKVSVKLKENTFFINYKYFDDSKLEILEKKIINLLCIRYYSRLKNYVDNLNLNSYNFKICGFELKNLNSKWGHCTFNNKLMLNLKLLNADPKVLDYVIYHEICHIKHKNHSINFWNEVSIFCYNHKVLRKVLKDSPPVIFSLK